MTAAQQRLPVTVITGFLGSGKTTLLNQLMRDPAFRNSAVIVNEFGDVGIDHLLVGASRDQIVLLDAGCLCCVMADSLRETLADLYHQRSQGAVPAFDRVLIETSGLADPGPILQTLIKDPLLAPIYEFAGLVCAVDVINALDQLHRYVEAREQIALADRIILTKLDLCPAPLSPDLPDQLRKLNPLAKLISVSKIEGSIAVLFEFNSFYRNESNFHETHAQHSSGIMSCSFKIAEAVNWSGIAAWTRHLSERFGDNLLRCKALLKLEQRQGRVIVQGVGRMFDSKFDSGLVIADEQSRIVVIGLNLDHDEVRLGLSWLSAPKGEQQQSTRDFPPWLNKP